jgi:UPF0716 protein FxsA
VVPVLLVLVFVVVPLAELFVLIQVGQEIGALPTIGILVVDSILGSLLLRSQGRAVWRRFNEALNNRRPPAREVLDGALVIFGGALLLTPGFLTDILGLLLLLPPTRAVVRRVLLGWFGRRFVVARVAGAAAGAGSRRMRTRGSASGGGGGGGGRSDGRDGREAYDVEGQAVDIDPPPLQR